jgi:hypothetical protein
MSKFDFSTIDPAKKASFKQILGVSSRFSGPDFKVPGVNDKKDYAQGRRIMACILEYHNNVIKKDITHGEIQSLFKAEALPACYVTLYDANKKKAPSAPSAPSVPAALVVTKKRKAKSSGAVPPVASVGMDLSALTPEVKQALMIQLAQSLKEEGKLDF